ncbi:MAG TPA: phospholipase D-like domain-containing protein [Burkholderiales bacterium]|nr:phospholipase D-like domain-containing protein [Burkholderiales bacterium]
MSSPFDLAFGAVALAVALVTAGHAVIYKREPRSAALWVLLAWLMPIVGGILYVLFGVNRVQRRAARLRRDLVRVRTTSESDERLPITDLVPLARLVGEVVERPLLAGNTIEPLVDGVEAYPAMLQAIDQARTSVALGSYIFHANGIGESFVNALIRARQRGVAVRVLIDDVSCRFSLHSPAKRLRRAGVPVGDFNPPLVPARLNAFNLRNHRKILVVDGELGFTGGMNIDRRYWGEGAYRDTHFRLRGPVVAHLMEVFVDDWLFTTDEALRGPEWFPQLAASGDSLARGIEAGPDEAFERLRWTYLGAINAAQRTVRICTPYFIPDGGIVSALDAAALRGVDVDIVLPEETDLPHIRWAMVHQLWQVLDRGCRVWMRPGPFDHSKLMVVDAHWTFVGSGNWDARSLRLNFEFNVESYCRRLGRLMDELIVERRAGSRRISLDDVNARPPAIKLRDGIARLFAPLL